MVFIRISIGSVAQFETLLVWWMAARVVYEIKQDLAAGLAQIRKPTRPNGQPTTGSQPAGSRQQSGTNPTRPTAGRQPSKNQQNRLKTG